MMALTVAPRQTATPANRSIGGILCSKEQADQLDHFWDGSMETARMLSVVMKAPLWQIRSWAQSCGLPPASDAVKTKWPPEPHPEDERVIVTEVQTQSPLPALTEDQQAILKKVWTGAGERTRQAAAVLAREFAIQQWQVRAWATRLGIAEPNLDEFRKEVQEIVGVDHLPALAEFPEQKQKETSMHQPAPVTEKRCSRCKKVKPLTEFGGSPHTTDHRTRCCAACLSEVKQERLGTKGPGKRQAKVEVAAAAEVAPRMEIMAPVLPDRDPIPQFAPKIVERVDLVEQLPAVSGRYEMLYMLLRELPESGRMVEREYERWWAAFAGVFGYLVRVEEQEAR